MKYCIALIQLVFIFLIGTQALSQTSLEKRIIQKEEQSYLSNTILIKFRNVSGINDLNDGLMKERLAKLLNGVGLISSQRLFLSNDKFLESGINRIMLVNYSSEIDPQILASKIRGRKDVEWAEPKYVHTLDFMPDDPLYSSQYAMQKVKAQEAWDVTTGDTAVVIAIIDTGVDWDHPDLSQNIWMNLGEIPNNGIDDDNNGYVDDIRGWDFGGLDGTPDNNPMEDRPDHGTHVAGDASAVTNNSIGVASLGFKSKIMCVKTSQDNFRNISNLPYVVFGYEGIKYAADNGADIINCSWGGGGFSIFEQEVINYAASLGALVVAAAGNNNSSSSHYPSAYKNVLSVAATNETDTKASFSNYGSWVDVSAPGTNINSTWQNDTYTSGNGTSFSSPITAGLAALVKSRFPSFTPNQIAEQIRVNCDDINSINSNYVNLLGKGRINAFYSVSKSNSISVRAVDVKFSDEQPGGNGDGVFLGGEIVTVKCSFVNFLNPTSSLVINLESKNSYSTVLNGNFVAGSKAMLESFDNFSNAFSFEIGNDVPPNTKLFFNLIFSDGDYEDFQVIEVLVNQTYQTQTGNNVALTITSKGTLAFNDYPNNTQGDGFAYLGGPNHLFEGALILANSSSQVSDCARDATGSSQSSDFTTIQPFTLLLPGNIADVEGSTIFSDDTPKSTKIGIETKLNSYSFSSTQDQNYILLTYALTNTSSAVINNLYAGLFFDWDIIDGSDDFTTYDAVGNFGYAYHVVGDPTTWVASAVVSSPSSGYWAINNAGDDGGFGIYDGFTDAEKWQTLSSGIGKLSAGTGDVSYVLSDGPHSIQPNETVRIAFSIAAGSNIEDLRTAIANSRLKYPQIPTSVQENENEVPKEFYLSQNYPNPFNPSTSISWETPVSGHQTLSIFDVLGNCVKTIFNEFNPAGKYSINLNLEELTSGVYFYQLRAGNFIKTKKMVLLR